MKQLSIFMSVYTILFSLSITHYNNFVKRLSKRFFYFYLFIYFALKKYYNIYLKHLASVTSVAKGRGRQLALSTTVLEQAQSNRACTICNFVVLGFL